MAYGRGVGIVKLCVGMSAFSARQAFLLSQAQALFIFNQVSNFPFYYLPGFRGLLGGDAAGETKFPASISWMTRRGLPRWSTLVLWNAGWIYMAAALLKEGDLTALAWPDWLRALFMLQMYATGFVVVVLTPMKGPDVALGRTDALHCYAAMAYVANHALALQFVLGVGVFTSAYGLGFSATTVLCGTCQFLRADNDRCARQLYVRCMGSSKDGRFETFTHVLELGFMLNENLLFLIFLVGMTSGLQDVSETQSTWSWRVLI